MCFISSPSNLCDDNVALCSTALLQETVKNVLWDLHVYLAKQMICKLYSVKYRQNPDITWSYAGKTWPLMESQHHTQVTYLCGLATPSVALDNNDVILVHSLHYITGHAGNGKLLSVCQPLRQSMEKNRKKSKQWITHSLSTHIKSNQHISSAK